VCDYKGKRRGYRDKEGEGEKKEERERLHPPPHDIDM